MALPETSIPATGVAQERRAAHESARKREHRRPPGMALERLYPASLVGIVLFGAALRFATLDMRSFWSDEAATVRFVSMSLGEMVSTITSEESTPPLYYLLAWFWAELFGVGEIGLRTLSALIGTATIGVVYAVGAHVAGRRVGLLAALLAAISPLLVWHSQDARAYALVIFLSGLSLLFFLGALAAPRLRTVIAWAVASSLLVTSHYFAVFLILPEALWLLVRHRSRRVVVAVGLVGLVGLALLVPASRVPDAAWIVRTSLVSRIAQIPAQFLVGYQPPWQIAVSGVAALLALVGLWLLATRGEREEWARLRVPAVIGATAVLLPILLAAGGYDRLLTRAVTIAWIPLAVVVTAGFGVRRAGWVGVSALTAICGLFLAVNVVTANDPKFERDDWRGAAAAVGPPASRAIVLSSSNGLLPMSLYRPASQEMTVGGARVNEIVLIGTPREHREIGVRPRPPRPAAVAPPLPGFVQVERIDDDVFTLVRFRSPTFVRVGPELADSALGEGTGGVLVEKPVVVS